MKRAYLLGLSLVGMLVFAVPAHAQQSQEMVERFDTAITLNADATMRVVETLDYNFGSGQHHGIYRLLPFSYRTDLGSRSIEIRDIKVADQNGTPYLFTTSKEGTNLRIKIGDPNSLVIGTKTYVISYTVDRMMGYFKDFDELYWNATGNAWVVPIGEASVTLTLPKPLPKENLSVSCYEGGIGSKEACATQSKDSPQGIQTIEFSSNHSFSTNEGLTVAVGFPKGVVYQPTRAQSFLATIKDNWVIGVPVMVLLAMFGLWYRKGRDPRGRGTIVPQYESPENLTPLEVYMLMHERVSNSAISSEIIYLATRGYLKISRIDDKVLFFDKVDYMLTKLKEGTGLPPAETALLNGLFKSGNEIKLSELKNSFYKNISSIKKAATAAVIEKNLFPSDPNMTRMWYVLAGSAVMFLAFYLGSFGVIAVVSGALSGAIIIVFGLFMPKVTTHGAEVREEVRGLKMYMDVAEKDRIKFHNAPEKNPKLFETLLPFAMVLGVEAAWAKQFEGIYTQPPSWYSDPSMRAFNPILFTSNLNSFTAGAASTLASAPSGGSGSGGGGFSGGGFGGGGGGSW